VILGILISDEYLLEFSSIPVSQLVQHHRWIHSEIMDCVKKFFLSWLYRMWGKLLASSHRATPAVPHYHYLAMQSNTGFQLATFYIKSISPVTIGQGEAPNLPSLNPLAILNFAVIAFLFACFLK